MLLIWYGAQAAGAGETVRNAGNIALGVKDFTFTPRVGLSEPRDFTFSPREGLREIKDFREAP